MKFNQLAIGSEFNFDHSILTNPLDIAQGPWVKVSARGYCHKSEYHVGQLIAPATYHKVGKITVEVIPS